MLKCRKNLGLRFQNQTVLKNSRASPQKQNFSKEKNFKEKNGIGFTLWRQENANMGNMAF